MGAQSIEERFKALQTEIEKMNKELTDMGSNSRVGVSLYNSETLAKIEDCVPPDRCQDWMTISKHLST